MKLVVAMLLSLLLPLAALAQGGDAAQALLAQQCLACHAMAATPDTLAAAGWLVRGEPDASKLVTRVDDGSMPPGAPLDEPGRALLRAWVAEGAPAALADTPAPTPSAAGKRMKFHRVAGYTSSGLLLAGGTIGLAQWGSMAAEGHAFREREGGDGEDDDCVAHIQDTWSDPTHAALRGAHGGLIAAGEVLNIANAVSGMRMRTQGFKAGKLHRVAMITNASLLLAEVGLGVGTTMAMSRGDHDALVALGGTHAVVGLTIPIVMLGSGIAIDHATR